MPKESSSAFIRRMRELFPNVSRDDPQILYCLLDDCVIGERKLFLVKQHIDSGKHKKSVAKKNESTNRGPSQSSIDLVTSKPGPKLSEFNMDLCQACVEANIPLSKVNHPSVKRFVEKYTAHPVPDQTTLRRNYLPVLYTKLIKHIRSKAAGKRIWTSVDETTDSENRMLANFVFGILDDVCDREK